MKLIKENVWFEEALPYLRNGHAITPRRCGDVFHLVNERHTPKTPTKGVSNVVVRYEAGELTGELHDIENIDDDRAAKNEDDRIKIKLKDKDGNILDKSFLGTYDDIMVSGWDVYEI